MNTDQQFVCLVPGEVEIKDLSLLVGEGEVVTIPADKALDSQDLWRAVNQKLLFRIRQGQASKGVTPPSDALQRVATLEREKADLEARAAGLQAQVEGLRRQVEERDGEIRVLRGMVASQPAPDPRLDAILADLQALKGRPAQVVVAQGSAMAPAPAPVVDPSLPIFLPTFEKPQDARVQVQETTSEGSTQSAQEALRKLRKKLNSFSWGRDMHPRQSTIAEQAQAMVDRTATTKEAGATLWKYTCPESGQDFYLPKKMATVKSPYSGKSFSAKPEKASLADVSKELKEDAKKSKKASDLDQPAAAVAAEFLTQAEHPALAVVASKLDRVQRVRKASADALAQAGGQGATDYVRPVIQAMEELSAEAATVAEQLTLRTQG